MQEARNTCAQAPEASRLLRLLKASCPSPALLRSSSASCPALPWLRRCCVKRSKVSADMRLFERSTWLRRGLPASADITACGT
jgi:hypothetical protein